MFKLKNKDLSNVYGLLFDLKLPFRLTRKRARFIEELQNHYTNVYQKGRDELIKHFADKDENGNVITLEDGGFTIPTSELEAFTNEINILDNELYQLEVNEINKELLTAIYEIVSSEDYIIELSGQLAITHDILCTELERVLEL